MRLSTNLTNSAHAGLPVVFLHGLLGASDDWVKLFAQLQNFPQISPLAFDLPCHGNETATCHSFADARNWLADKLNQILPNQPFWLVGYSLGGRLALDYFVHQTNPNLCGIVLEGANIGLKTAAERHARWQNDQHWANRFRHEQIEKVLQDWYQQAVFADLTDAQRSELIQQRKQNNGNQIATMLAATSLAKQPDFSGINWQRNGKKVHFLIGERDHKFRQMAQQNALPHRLIAQAGHNAHRENPADFSANLLAIIETA